MAPVVIGYIVQATHSYAIPFGILGGAIFVAGLIIATVREKRIELSLSPAAASAATGAPATQAALVDKKVR